MISFYDLNKKTMPQQVYKNTKDIEELKQQIGTWYNTKSVLTKESTSIPRVETDVPADVTQGFILTELGLLFKITGVYSDLLYITYYSELQQGPQGIQGVQGQQGVGIENIESNGYTDAEGYTLTHIDALLTNGITEHFDVKAKQGLQGIQGETGVKGEKGDTGPQGVGIEKIESNGYTDTEGYTLTHIDALLTNGTTEHFDVQAKQGPQGPQGPAGSEPVAVTITPDSATSGTLTQEQLNILQDSVENYIILANEIYILMDNQHESGLLTYSHVCQDTSKNFYIKCIVVTISTLGWVKTEKSTSNLKRATLTSFKDIANYENKTIYGINITTSVSDTGSNYDSYEITTSGISKSSITESINNFLPKDKQTFLPYAGKDSNYVYFSCVNMHRRQNSTIFKMAKSSNNSTRIEGPIIVSSFGGISICLYQQSVSESYFQMEILYFE